MYGSKGRTPMDSVSYSIYPDFVLNSSSSQIMDHLQALATDCLNSILPYMEGYIWQHQPFNLELPSSSSSSTSSCICNCEPTDHDGLEWESFTPSSSNSSSSSIAHLHGKVKFGDNIEDEWFVVFLLYQISHHFPQLSVRVWDTDGEFLLIEAAYHIPKWLKPENSWNRVFIRQGLLHIIPFPSSPSELYQLPMKPSLQDALRVLSLCIVNTRAHDEVQQAIARRLAGYPLKAQQNMHNVCCRLPLPIAQILKHEPQFISLAVEAFYDRDIDSMKAASKMEKFLPKGPDKQVEMVDVIVRMSKAMYAQLVQQVFQAPRCYPMPPFSDTHFKEAELGMKITCGFEMFYWERSRYELCEEPDADQEAGTRKERVVSNDPVWQTFRKSLEEKGYFRNLVDGSKEYRELMGAAITSYQQTDLYKRVSKSMHDPVKRINEILSLPYDVHDFVGTQELHSDDDSWLYSGEDDLKNAMLERQREMEAYESKIGRKKDSVLRTKKSAWSTAAKDFNSETVVRSMQAFVNKLSSFEGAEVPGVDDVHPKMDQFLSLDMERFLKELNSAVGSDIALQEDSLFEDMETSSSDLDFDNDDSQEDMNKEEDHASTSETVPDETEEGGYRKADTLFMDEYSEVLNHQLRNSSLAKTFAQAEKRASNTSEARAKVECLPPVNVDANLIQSLLESYSMQQGLPGPASNLLGAMGINLPDDSKEEKKE